MFGCRVFGPVSDLRDLLSPPVCHATSRKHPSSPRVLKHIVIIMCYDDDEDEGAIIVINYIYIYTFICILSLLFYKCCH